MTHQTPEELLDALDPQQREVAIQVTGPLCVRAGAGAGKTRAITYRIAYSAATGAVDPSSVLAVTFTAKAAAEMRSRLRDLGVSRTQPRTFHAAALRQLRYFWPKVFGGEIPHLAAHKASLVAAAAARCGLSVDRATVRDLAGEVEWAKVSMVRIEDYPKALVDHKRNVPASVTPDEFMRLYAAYEQAKEDRQVIDFEDVLVLTCGILSEHEHIAAQVRRQYRNFVIDEYQDVSPLQQHLLDLWCGPRRDICVVGDVAQTIYSFAGASSRYLLDFPTRFEGARSVELVRDYRSTPQVVAVANQIVARARGNSGIGPERGLEGAVRLQAQRPSGPAVEFRSYESDEEEASAVATRIGELRATGVSLAHIAVLYRTNAQSAALERALSEVGIGFQMQDGGRFFEREEIKRAVLLLRQSARIRSLVGQQGEPTETAALVEEVENVVTSLGWTAQEPPAEGATRSRWENLDALLGLARQRASLTLEAFVEELIERASAQAAPEKEGVVLSTLHAAKGLEWDAVFIIGVSEGLIPISFADAPETVEEERRLLYVGVTRAREHLQLSWARTRGGGRSQRRRLSRFLEPLWPQEKQTRPPNRKASSKTRSRDAKKQFEKEADSSTQGLYEELRQWRLSEAKTQEVPAFAIVPDTTLRDIATAKPHTLRQLRVLRGIGDNRLEKYGSPILKVIREYRESNHQK